MSYAEQTRPQKPLSMAAAVAINGAIIAAVMLSPMVVNRPKKDPPIVTFNQELKKPPPPDQQPKVAPRPLPPIDAPPPPFDYKPLDNPPIINKDPPIIDPGIIDGKGIGDPIIKPPIVEPPVAIFKHAFRDPKFASAFQPPYPSRMLHAQIEGSATVRVLVGTDGRVRQADVVRATHPDFGTATVRQALKAWRFKPATRGGQPVEDWQTLSVTFVIT